MSSNETTLVLREAPRRTSATCQPLLEAATPDLFLNNAFRITGLLVDAATREIAKHADRLKMLEELGRGSDVHKLAFALKPPPTVDEIRDAMHRLRDPERRMVDELLRFWPERFGETTSDPAIRALTNGDHDCAMRIGAAREKDSLDGVVATLKGFLIVTYRATPASCRHGAQSESRVSRRDLACDESQRRARAQLYGRG